MAHQGRDAALALLREWTKSPSLIAHALSVEAAMRAYARELGEDEETWGITGLLHDFDYEKHPSAEEHPYRGVEELRARGYDEKILTAILGHAPYTGVARESRMAKALFAVDELCGMITAVALVRPSQKVAEVTPKSVKKKMKASAFARNVSREHIHQGAEELGVELDTHIRLCVEAMSRVAAEIGLAGTEPDEKDE